MEILNDTERVNQIKEWIGAGIASAFADLANVFSSHADLLEAIGSTGYDKASAADRDVTAGKAAAKYVRDTEGGAMNNTQAAAELMGYVTQECEAARKSTGGKWYKKLF